ncbi:MAG: NifB/NifX family molybdenum-iron cluster-binding protein [Candidatus Micrarchaeia archaeon]
MVEKIIMAVVDLNGMLIGIGRAPRVEIAHVKDNRIDKIDEIDVRWDEAHETEQEGLHHATVAKFIKEHNVNEIIASGVGPDMKRMLERLGIKVRIANGYYKDYIL